MFELVTVNTKDGLLLKGLYAKGLQNKPVVIQLHGYSQDFFQNEFILKIANKLQEHQIGFLSVMIRGTGTEFRIFTTSKNARMYGAKHELLEEAYLDIDAWIQLLADAGHNQIILQGHSLGSIKAIRYLIEGSFAYKISQLILLSPYDKNYLIREYTKDRLGEYLQKAQLKIANGKGLEQVPDLFSPTPSTYQNYFSFYMDSDLSNLFNFHQPDYSFPILQKIEIPTLMLVGKKDPYFHPSNPDHPEEALEMLDRSIKNFHGESIDGAKHRFLGKEDLLANLILDFVQG
ncbi:hypothetical protein A2631_03685 [Candidatus Daviesbacteria bacterium RIFCSPHIGHO2_01_FULL_44_29]|uniref:Serine aminopeptidase S33 domain-containing protein n=1 Tax=Candidatus Daviesbacteria bacterium RIFCSPHIGHO2_02_FULL_43_12 TaxID=1797776 RepID=A0A1F5KIL9_9BACT|nr:MAG: hypothetical protein A2631_03685 [Candidatus Daviesbacteria bacterium RIFCSPHIGHO2_01_FULL_44_29]OGE39824.1 MAG: hypothetical protein A3E86_04620 [Candidatus Daviesbacteria bacterium RIFCSPHIGHO2_12_FULL_47_45]OGE40461.1 MAG: hypothetical protein A3D25_00145 [Candidatus Daviesbacteria bacterium RIFCSPHIGHO2_02_FULL_43_12]OGE70012.1 MAG: hypothetical protein A3B55_04950 [Candidatus Daviesbacteria bacterium RIFCSPLOWO2_01_FULL_43_15]